MNAPDIEPPIPTALVRAGGVEYPVAVPHHETDYIQAALMETGQPYEQTMLEAMARLVSADDLALDVGANMGNHSLFLAHVVGCRVIAFEPNRELVRALDHSLRIGGITDRIETRRCALGNSTHKGSLTGLDASNLGRQSVAIDDDAGDFEVIRLDDLELPGRVALIKIDVEGMELDVLEGGSAVIQRDRPALFVEAMDAASFERIATWMREHDYCYQDTYNATPTHHFRPGTAAEAEMNAIAISLVRERYDLQAESAALRASVHETGLRYRQVTQAQSREKEQYVATLERLQLEQRAQIDELKERHRLRVEALKDKQARRRRALRAERDRARDELEALAAGFPARAGRLLRRLRGS